jgi:extracellular elastinolytic metalloproteinase
MRVHRLTVLGASALTAVAMSATGIAGLSSASPALAAGHKLLKVASGDPTPFLGRKPYISDRDVRRVVTPAAGVRRAVAALGRGVTVSYNRFGTPSAITRDSKGWLATGLRGGAVAASREWLSQHRDLFGLTSRDLANLQLVNNAHLKPGPARAVLLRQTFGDYHAGNDGLVAVGIRHGKVASVTSTLVGGQRLDAAKPVLSPLQAVLAAAHDDGLRALTLSKLSLAPKDHTTFTNVAAKGLAGVQRTRLVALPTTHGARLAYETDVNNLTANPLATISFVDALTGRVLVRHNVVDTLANGAGSVRAASIVDQASAAPTKKKQPANPLTFSGDFTPTACSPKIPLEVPAGSKSLAVVVNTTNAENDIALNVYRGSVTIGSSDEASSPEAVAATLRPAAKAGDKFFAEVCPSSAPLGPFIAPYSFQGVYAASSQTASTEQVNAPYPPEWKYYPDSPRLGRDKDTRTKTCWTRKKSNPAVTHSVKGCQQNAANRASRTPWDVVPDVAPNVSVPTFTTSGNNAKEAEAWYSTTLTPGPTSYNPISTNRLYTFPFTDQWFTSKCALTDFASTDRADIDPVATNLFVGHNLFHDFSYRLGFTEKNYNNQIDNFGLTGPSQADDPEIGDVQSGAVTNLPIAVVSGATGEALPVEGRDNANQVPEQDGVPGITNQYLFQPLVGFYPPCHDGDLDMSVYGHEYTHEISNRMIAGPDTGLGGAQGGAMGESWSDLDALEFLNSMGYAGMRGEKKDTIGAYATGNKRIGIRDYRPSKNPLNYSDIGFDTTGPEVHADGEVWNGIQWHVRQALVNKYNHKFPASDRRLERACAIGHFAHGLRAPGFFGCPGDRHWIQYIYDAWLLEANGNPTYIDMKNMMLAADKAIDHSRDHKVMANAFAHGGLGKDASSTGGDDTDPQGGFASPVGKANAHVTFDVRDSRTNKRVKATIYVGDYQARVTPYASTYHNKKKGPGATHAMFRGHYHFLVQAPGYGERRFAASFTPGKHYTQVVRVDPNYASKHSGATISGPGVRLTDLIDDDENTDAGFDGSATSTPLAGQAWTVKLSGKHKISSVRVSAEHHPLDENDPNDFQSRFADLRSFVIQVSSNGGKSYKTVKSSGKNFFPGRLPRPVVPTEILRGLRFKPVKADHVRLVIKSNMCTGFNGYRDTDADPTNDGDCRHTTLGFQVTAAELQVYRPDHKPVTVQKVRKH